MLQSFGMNVWNHQTTAIFEMSGGLLLLRNICQYKAAIKILIKKSSTHKKIVLKLVQYFDTVLWYRILFD